jgi:lysosomal Pro-X carboxypeptidase
MSWLTSEQAMADYAVLIAALKTNLTNPALPWIGFGGSYGMCVRACVCVCVCVCACVRVDVFVLGVCLHDSVTKAVNPFPPTTAGGMLATYFRIKYPYLIDGVIAGSAPIWAFLGLSPAYDAFTYAKTMTRDASAAGGATDNCKANFRRAQPRVSQLASSVSGRALLSQAFRTCKPLSSAEEASGLISWAQEPWSFLAMGNFPYASSYLLHGRGLLPPWPVRVACTPLDSSDLTTDSALMEAVREAASLYYNYTHKEPCFYNGPASTMELPRARMMPRRSVRLAQQQDTRVADDTVSGPSACAGDWDYQYCTEMVMPFSQGGPDDMFWPLSTFDLDGTAAGCLATWGVKPRAMWSSVALAPSDLSSATNIVFSNGLLDPWHGGGVLRNVSSSVVSLIIANGAHHLDLMFADPADPPDVRAVRAEELRNIQAWIDQKKSRVL